MKKILSTLFSTLQVGARGGLLILALMTTTALWAQRFQSDNLYYNITSDSAPYTVEVNDAVSSITTVTIPETVTYNGTTYSVTSIGSWAFNYCNSLTSVTIGNSVTSIGYEAFSGCSSLSSVTIPNSVTSIGNRAFKGCSSLTFITIPNSVTSIGVEAFADCSSLESITIPNSVTSIGEYAFQYCRSLTSITIPNSVTSIGYKTFYGCSSLTSITIPNSVTSIGYEAFSDCESLTSITIGNSVTSIGGSAFYNTGIYNDESNWENGVLYISNCLIDAKTDITGAYTINDGTRLITDDAFYECSSLTSVIIPYSVTSIGRSAFRGCSSLTSINIPNSVTSIGDDAFSYCSSLTYLSIPNSVKYAEEDEDGEIYYYEGFSSIMHCYNLKTLIVPADFFGAYGDEDDYQYVMENNFPYLPKKLESLTINDGEIHRLAWDMIYASYKTLKTIDLATTTDVTIEEEAFKNCYQLENLMLPSQLEAVPYMAVAECVKLQSITIPATVTEIDDRAFENCRSIKSIIFEGADPAQSPARHAAASGSALTRIGNWAFYNCHQLENLTIPEGVTEVGDAAFYGCSYLTDMILPSTVQSIGDNGFALCAKLQKIYVNALTPPAIQAKTFFDVNRQIPVYVPDEVVDAYKSDPYWKEFNIQGKSNAPSAVENIGAGNNADVQKIMRNGQLLILKDGKTYNAMGAEIK